MSQALSLYINVSRLPIAVSPCPFLRSAALPLTNSSYRRLSRCFSSVLMLACERFKLLFRCLQASWTLGSLLAFFGLLSSWTWTPWRTALVNFLLDQSFKIISSYSAIVLNWSCGRSDRIWKSSESSTSPNRSRKILGFRGGSSASISHIDSIRRPSTRVLISKVLHKPLYCQSLYSEYTNILIAGWKASAGLDFEILS